jgi:hypothetical protein
MDKKKPYNHKIRIDSSGASEWVNMLEYFMSDEGKEELKKLSEFAERNRKRNEKS